MSKKSFVQCKIIKFGVRIPVGARFSAPAQNGPGAHLASYTKGTGSFPGVKRPGRGVDHPRPSSAEVNPFPLELDIYSLAHHLCKMRIFMNQEG